MSVPLELPSRSRAGLRAAGWVAAHPGLTLAALYLILNIVSVFAPEWLTRYDPLAADPVSAQLGSSTEHWLGTDQLGRDYLRARRLRRTLLLVDQRGSDRRRDARGHRARACSPGSRGAGWTS